MKNIETLRNEYRNLFLSENNSVSDLDDDSLSIEWETPLGSTYWQKFSSFETYDEALRLHSEAMNEWVEEQVQAHIERDRRRKAEYEASRNTLGNLFPGLKKLL